MSDALKIDPDKVRRLSLSEQELVKAAASHGADLIRYLLSVRILFVFDAEKHKPVGSKKFYIFMPST